MLRRWPLRREAVPGGVADTGLTPEFTVDEAAGVAAEHDAPAGAVPAAPGLLPFRLNKKRIALLILAAVFVAMGGVYTQKDKIAPKFADTSRGIIGDENTARVEGWYFKVSDKVDQLKYRYFGAEENPFKTGEVAVQLLTRPALHPIVYIPGSSTRESESVLTADTLGVAPMVLPATRILLDSPQPGEGVWSAAGLPRSNPNDILMAKTFIRPDKTRPYASVGLLIMDSRRIRLNMVAGTGDPGAGVGNKGPGILPSDKYSSLLLAWNGGFKGAHGSYGMYADGKTYLPLRNGLGTVVAMKDGTIKVGEWGRDFVWDDNIVAVRQNVVPLVIDGEISRRVTEGNDTWGYVGVNSAEFITWRSGLGVTRDGNLIYAAGNSLSAETLAKALWAAGAYSAMQLDINSPYVLLGQFFQNPDGSLQSEKFISSMADSPTRFLRTQERDFMYVTLDETRYRN